METWLAIFMAINILAPIILISSFEDDGVCNATTAIQNVCCYDSQWSCKYRCGTYNSFVCSCHHNCLLYDRCCEDFQEQCPDLYNNASLLLSRHRGVETTCHPYFWRWVVSSCPKGTTDLEAQRRCTSDTPESFLDVILIKDYDIEVEYKNIYCHRCNNNSSTSKPEPIPFGFILNVWYDFYNVGFTRLWQMMNEPGAVMDVTYELFLGGMACINDRQNDSRTAYSYNGLDTRCLEDFSSIITLSKDTTYRVYRNKHCRECEIENSNIPCRFKSRSDLTYVSVHMFYDRNTQMFMIRFTDSILYKWQTLLCNTDVSECRKICAETVPVINGSCNPDFKSLYLKLKVRALTGDGNELQDLTDAERNVTSLNIIEIKSVFNRSIPWRVLDRSEEAPTWSVCIELASYYRLPTSPFDVELVKSSFRALVSNLTKILKHASDNRTLHICLELSYSKEEKLSFECSGTLAKEFVLSEKDAARSKAISFKHRRIQVALYFAMTVVFCSLFLKEEIQWFI